MSDSKVGVASCVERYKELDSWKEEWGGDAYELHQEEISAMRAERDTLWDTMTDKERAEAGAHRIVCAICDRNYGRGIGEAQGADCAANIVKGNNGKFYILCHYGSEYDGNVYEVLETNTGDTEPTQLRTKLSPTEIQIIVNIIRSYSKDNGIDIKPSNIIWAGSKPSDPVALPENIIENVKRIHWHLSHVLDSRGHSTTRKHMNLLPVKEADPVCDICLADYMEAGMLREIGDYLHDDEVGEVVD